MGGKHGSINGRSGYYVDGGGWSNGGDNSSDGKIDYDENGERVLRRNITTMVTRYTLCG